MVHVYLHGYCPSGSAMHRHSMLMGREMWNKHFVFLCSTHFIQLSYKFGPILFRTPLPTLLSQKEGNYTHTASLNSFFVLLLNVFAPHLCNIICLHTHTDPYTPGCTGASMLMHPWTAKPKKGWIIFKNKKVKYNFVLLCCFLNQKLLQYEIKEHFQCFPFSASGSLLTRIFKCWERCSCCNPLNIVIREESVFGELYLILNLQKSSTSEN